MHISFGRWLGDPSPFPDFKYIAMLDPIDWLHWYQGNNIDMIGAMFGSVPADAPPITPPWTPADGYPPGWTDTAARNVLIIYAEHETSLEDPLAPGEYSDTAQAAYDNNVKWLGLSKADWVAAGYDDPNQDYPGADELPPLTVCAEIMWGDSHPWNVVHLGLDTNTDTITPYVVPASTPNGYYLMTQPTLTGLLPTNTAGSDTHFALRQQILLKEILNSDYFTSNINSNLIYDRNMPGVIDVVILVVPSLYKLNYYRYSMNSSATISVLSEPINIGTRQIDRVAWEPGETFNIPTIHHEYLHTSYMASGISYTPELFADKAWVGGDEPVIKLSGHIPDIYENQTPYPAEPYRRPCINATHFAFRRNETIFCGVLMHPLQAAQFYGLTLNDWATSSGSYTIKSFRDSYEILCIQSPYDQTQYLMLQAFYPLEIDGGFDYPWSKAAMKGVYATVFKPYWPSGSVTPVYANTYNPIKTYMIDTCTEYYSYGDIGTQDTRTIAATSAVETNKKLVLLDHANPTTNPSGLSNLNAPFGVTVEFVEWTQDANEIWQATVDITIDAV